MTARRVPAELRADPARVIARLFLPGEEMRVGRSRASQVVARVLSIPEDEIERLAAAMLDEFGPRHDDYEAMLGRHAAIASAHVDVAMTAARTLVLGATFTAEYAVEGAALCNPSAVLHPDQSGLGRGEIRAAISLRGIGEGHISSIGFCSAIIGPGARWSFEQRPLPISAAVTTPARWRRAQLRAVLADQGGVDELAAAVLHALPVEFEVAELERALAAIDHDLLRRSNAAATIELVRKVMSSAYVATFAASSELGQRVLSPSAEEESNGMEDARFTRFIGSDGAAEYRATYTAYDGREVAPRLLVSADLRVFRAHRLAGSAAHNKGMALFPRTVDGRFLSLCRSDGENISLASSTDGYQWGRPQLLHGPAASWELLQVGNCGPPIEITHGWLVLTHGVGPMRTYGIGALLLDLDDPTRVLGRMMRPLLSPGVGEHDGYVPNVVYSCGAIMHDDIVWIPYGIDDFRIGVAYIPLDQILAELSSTS